MIKIVRRRLKSGEIKEYRYGEPAPRSVGAVILEYKMSPQFRGLKPASRESYDAALTRIREFERTPVEAIRRRHILAQRDVLANTPAVANRVVTVWSIIMGFAVEREYIQVNPCRGIRRLRTGEHGRWSDAAVAVALSLREPIRRAVLLALYTGQRASDCVRMMWGDYDGKGIAVRQEKTGEALWIPCHSALKAELDSWARTSTHILTNKHGKPWRRGAFLHAVSDAFRRRPELNGCVFHGLRKTAAAKLAEAGCPPHHIAAITGHKSLSMLVHYTKEASQREMATAAIARLENGGKTGKNRSRKILKFKGK